MIFWTVVLAVVAVGFVAVAANQQALWWKTAAWQFRHPEANEPSDASFAFNAVLLYGFAALAMIGALALFFQETPAEAERRRQQELASCQELWSRFEEAAEWQASEITNIGKIHSLARQLDVRAEIRSVSTETSPYLRPGQAGPPNAIAVSRPPGRQREAR